MPSRSLVGSIIDKKRYQTPKNRNLKFGVRNLELWKPCNEKTIGPKSLLSNTGLSISTGEAKADLLRKFDTLGC